MEPNNFRPLMPVVRSAANRLAEEGRIQVTQRGDPVDLDTAGGPVRLRLRQLNGESA